MSDDLNREIAELLGWTHVQEYSGQLAGIPPRDTIHRRADFTSSLDALRPLLRDLCEKDLATYEEWEKQVMMSVPTYAHFDPLMWASCLLDVLKERQDGAE